MLMRLKCCCFQMLSWNWCVPTVGDVVHGVVATSIYFLIFINVLLLSIIVIYRNTPTDSLLIAEYLYQIIWTPLSYVIGARTTVFAFMSTTNVSIAPRENTLLPVWCKQLFFLALIDGEPWKRLSWILCLVTAYIVMAWLDILYSPNMEDHMTYSDQTGIRPDHMGICLIMDNQSHSSEILQILKQFINQHTLVAILITTLVLTLLCISTKITNILISWFYCLAMQRFWKILMMKYVAHPLALIIEGPENSICNGVYNLIEITLPLVFILYTSTLSIIVLSLLLISLVLPIYQLYHSTYIPILEHTKDLDPFARVSWNLVQEYNDLCAVCLNKLYTARITTCGHMFHGNCLKQIIQHRTSCPLCNAALQVAHNE